MNPTIQSIEFLSKLSKVKRMLKATVNTYEINQLVHTDIYTDDDREMIQCCCVVGRMSSKAAAFFLSVAALLSSVTKLSIRAIHSNDATTELPLQSQI